MDKPVQNHLYFLQYSIFFHQGVFCHCPFLLNMFTKLKVEELFFASCINQNDDCQKGVSLMANLHPEVSNEHQTCPAVGYQSASI